MFARNAVTFLPRSSFDRNRQWAIDIDCEHVASDIYRYSCNLWIDLMHIEQILVGVSQGQVALVHAVDEEDVKRGIQLIKDIRKFGEHSLVVEGGVEGLTFICIRDNTIKKFKSWIWTIWFSFTERVNVFNVGFTSMTTPGSRPIIPDELSFHDDVAGTIVQARDAIYGGRWINRDTGRPFVFPDNVIFSPWVRMSQFGNRESRQRHVNAFVDLTFTRPDTGSFIPVESLSESHPEVVAVRAPEEEKGQDSDFEEELMTQAESLGL